MSARMRHLQALDVALAVGRDVDVLDLVAAVVGAHQRLAAGLGPLDRLAEPPGHQQGDDLLRRDLQLAAEAAADVRGDHAQLVLGDAGGHRQHDPQDVRHLGGGPHRVVVALRLDDDRPRLHERRDQPLLDEPAADHDVGVRERLVGVDPVPASPASKTKWKLVLDVDVVVARGAAPSSTARSMSRTTGSGS